ncbi:MAG: type II toxin-antitoxin system RelE/ParE family toxin [Gemmatimonadota bacterium]
MASYRIEIKRSAAKELERLPPKDRLRIATRIQALGSDPRPSGAEKLSGQDRYRVRQGDFRILYEVFDELVLVIVVRIRNRRDVYRK